MRWTQAGGFTLIELLIVILIIGVLAAIAVPQYFKSVETGKASEAVEFLTSLRGAQDRYEAKRGGYCTGAVADCSGFDLDLPPLKNFNAFTAFETNGTTGWKASLTRNDTPLYYGAYTITYAPAASPAMTCNGNDPCQNDLLPR